MSRVILKSGLRGWRMKLRKVYASTEEFERYSDIYDIARRLGYRSAAAAWAANPLIEGGVNPSDLRRAPRRDERLYGVRIKCYELPERFGFDRFTVCFPHTRGNADSRADTCEAVGCTGHTSAMMGRHLGRRVPFRRLPSRLRAVVRDDCREYSKILKAKSKS